MRRFLTVFSVIALLALAAAATTGCGLFAEKAAEELTEGLIEGSSEGDLDVEIDDDGETVTIGDEDGEMTISSGDSAEVPDEYPDDFPIYDGEITASSSMTTGEGSMVTVAVMTDDDFDDVKDWVESELASEGWTVLFQTDVTDSGMRTAGFNVEKGDRNGTIAVTEDDDGIVVSHTVLTSTE